MDITYRRTSQSISVQEIAEIESKWKIKFPDAFVQFYLQNNGGYPEPRVYYTWSDIEGSKTQISAIVPMKYPIKSFDRGIITQSTELEYDYYVAAILEHYFPIGMVPFGNDPGGNLFCISCREKDYGYVYWWSHEHGSIDDPEQGFEFLEKSFEDFLNKMTDIE